MIINGAGDMTIRRFGRGIENEAHLARPVDRQRQAGLEVVDPPPGECRHPASPSPTLERTILDETEQLEGDLRLARDVDDIECREIHVLETELLLCARAQLEEPVRGRIDESYGQSTAAYRVPQ